MKFNILLKRLIQKENILKAVVVDVMITTALLCHYGYSWKTLSFILLCQVLLVASVIDIETHTIPDYTYSLILLIGLIDVALLPALLGLLLVPLPLFIAACCSNRIGGGDVKLMGAVGFVVGVNTGYTALIFGLFFSVIVESYRKKFRTQSKEKEPFALVPYLTIGCVLALF